MKLHIALGALLLMSAADLGGNRIWAGYAARSSIRAAQPSPRPRSRSIYEASGTIRSTLSNSEGAYSFSQIVPATYTLTAEAPGFKKIRAQGRDRVHAAVRDAGHETGGRRGDGKCAGHRRGPLLEASNASQGQVVDRQKLIDLPNLGRNPFMMSRLAPPCSRWAIPRTTACRTSRARRRSRSTAVRCAATTTCSTAFRLPTSPTAP